MSKLSSRSEKTGTGSEGGVIMLFDNYEHQQDYLESFGIKVGDEIVVTAEGEFNGKTGSVVKLRLGFSGPLYNVSFHDGYGTIRDNRFTKGGIKLT